MAPQHSAHLLLPRRREAIAKWDGFVLGPEEVARILGRTSRDVAGLAREGKLRARRIGTRWRFRRQDVTAYLRGAFSD